MRELSCDVAVVGGGPAGATLAQRLGRLGFHVIVLEARNFPRHKPCGEFMNPASLEILEELHVLENVASLGARPIRGMKLFFHGRSTAGRYGHVTEAGTRFRHGFAVRRERFDEVLLRAALSTPGVEALQPATVARVLRGPGGEVLGVEARDADGERVTVKAPFTIGADGVRSRVARELGVHRPTPWLDKLALVTRYENIPWGAFAEAHFFDGGYFACAPVDGGLLSLNAVVDRRAYLEAAMTPEDFLRRSLEGAPELRERLAVGRRCDPIRGIASMAGSTTQQIFDGAALVGDAAGYVDPVTGEGIYIALRGSQLLAPVLASALHRRAPTQQSLAAYRTARRRELLPRRWSGLLLQRLLRSRMAKEAGIRILARNPGLADLAVSATGEDLPLRTLLSPSTILRAVGNRSMARAGA